MEIKDIIFIFMIIVIASLGSYNAYTLFKFQKTHDDILKDDEETNAIYLKNFNDLEKVNTAINTKLDSIRNDVTTDLQENRTLIQSNQSLIHRNKDDISIISTNLHNLDSNLDVVKDYSTNVNNMYDDYVKNDISFSSAKSMFDDYTTSKINFGEIQSHHSNAKLMFDDYTTSEINFGEIQSHHANAKSMFDDYQNSKIDFNQIQSHHSNAKLMFDDYNNSEINFTDVHNQLNDMYNDYIESGIVFSTINDNYNMYRDDYSNLKNNIFSDYMDSGINFSVIQGHYETASNMVTDYKNVEPLGFNFYKANRLFNLVLINHSNINYNIANIDNNRVDIDNNRADIYNNNYVINNNRADINNHRNGIINLRRRVQSNSHGIDYIYNINSNNMNRVQINSDNILINSNNILINSNNINDMMNSDEDLDNSDGDLDNLVLIIETITGDQQYELNIIQEVNVKISRIKDMYYKNKQTGAIIKDIRFANNNHLLLNPTFKINSRNLPFNMVGKNVFYRLITNLKNHYNSLSLNITFNDNRNYITDHDIMILALESFGVVFDLDLLAAYRNNINVSDFQNIIDIDKIEEILVNKDRNHEYSIIKSNLDNTTTKIILTENTSDFIDELKNILKTPGTLKIEKKSLLN